MKTSFHVCRKSNVSSLNDYIQRTSMVPNEPPKNQPVDHYKSGFFLKKIFQARNRRSVEGPHNRRREAKMGSSVQPSTQRAAPTVKTEHWKIKKKPSSRVRVLFFRTDFQLQIRPIWVRGEKEIKRRNPFRFELRRIRPIW